MNNGSMQLRWDLKPNIMSGKMSAVAAISLLFMMLLQILQDTVGMDSGR